MPSWASSLSFKCAVSAFEVTLVECARCGEPGGGGLFPIAWFRFDVVNDEAEATEQEQQQPGATARVALPGEFRFALAEPRALRYLVLKPGLFMITMSTNDYSETHLFMSMITTQSIYS